MWVAMRQSGYRVMLEHEESSTDYWYALYTVARARGEGSDIRHRWGITVIHAPGTMAPAVISRV